MDKIRILVVDDHPIMGQGLEHFLNLEPDMQVIGMAGDGLAGLELLRKWNPDVVVLDLSMPKMSGQEAISLYCQVKPALQIVIFSAHQDENSVHQALQAGANGYVIKGSSVKELIQAIRYVGKGGYWVSPQFSPGIMAAFLKSRAGAAPESEGFGNLSEREQQVFRLMVEGRETEQIAEILCIGGTTVAKHRSALMRKLGVKNAVEMTRYAIRRGLVEP